MILTFYNIKAIISELDKENLYLFQNHKSEIIMNHFDYKSNINKKEIITKDCNGEFDVTLIDNSLYVIYQDLLRNLNLSIINGNDIRNMSMTEEPIERIYELNIFNNDNQLNMVYLKSLGEKKYRIIHNYVEGDSWVSQNVMDVQIDQAINPMKIIKIDKIFILCFYNGNEVCIKELNSINSEWAETIVLSEPNSKKLYLDMIKIENNLHLVYSQFQNNNYVIIYERHSYNNGAIRKDFEKVISNESNCTNPTLILYDDKIWVVWNESNRLYSRHSGDGGNIWSSIHYWKESIAQELIRYKYLKENDELDFRFDFSFGTLNPEIKFVGFGPLENVEEINDKKKTGNGIIEISDIDYIEKEDIKFIEPLKRSEEMESKIELLEEDLIKSINKIRLIEDFLLKNTRGHYEQAIKKQID